MLRQILERQRIVGAIDKAVLRTLVAQDAEFAVDIVLQPVLVPVQMIGRNVRQHSDVGPEIVAPVELKAAQLDHVPVAPLRGDRQRETPAYVAPQSDVRARATQNLVGQRRRGRLAVTARDADRASRCVRGGELDFGHDRNSAFADRLHHRRLVGNAGALDDPVGIEYPPGRMLSLFVGHVPFGEQCFILGRDNAHIRQEYVESFHAGQHGRPAAALASSQHDNLRHGYLILSVTSVTAANSNCTILKRTTIFDSKYPFF